jgi:hypothetical protein
VFAVSSLKVFSHMLAYRTILPAIERKGVEIADDPKICFLRVRPDENLWTHEGCVGSEWDSNVKAVEEILNRKCFFKNPGAQTRPASMNHHCPVG